MIPHRPRTTLGIAASSSTSVATGRRIRRGASSVRKSAIAIDIGPAISSAIAELTAVPKMKAAAPNLPVTGFHSLDMRKPSPKCEIASLAWSKTL